MYEQQQAPMEQPYPMPGMMPGYHATEGSLHYQIDVQEIIEDIEHTLRGECLTFDQKSGRLAWMIPDNITPLINQRGINAILTILKSRITKIFILSSLDEDTIQEITIKIGESLIEDLQDNWEVYEVRDYSAGSHIVGLVTDTVYATLRKGMDGNYLKFLRSTQSIQEIQHRSLGSQRTSDPNDSIIKRLFGKKR